MGMKAYTHIPTPLGWQLPIGERRGQNEQLSLLTPLIPHGGSVDPVGGVTLGDLDRQLALPVTP